MVYGGKSCQLSLLKVGGAFYKSRQDPEAKDDEQDDQYCSVVLALAKQDFNSF